MNQDLKIKKRCKTCFVICEPHAIPLANVEASLFLIGIQICICKVAQDDEMYYDDKITLRSVFTKSFNFNVRLYCVI